MADTRLEVVPAEVAAWICRQQACGRAGCGECRQAVEDEVGRQSARFSHPLCREKLPASNGRLKPYAERIWMCAHYHWKRLGEPQAIEFARLTKRLEEGDLGYERSSTNVLQEVTLAQALQNNEPMAAQMFESEYMPRAILRDAGRDNRALDDGPTNRVGIGRLPVGGGRHCDSQSRRRAAIG
jgi:hypothetical protein